MLGRFVVADCQVSDRSAAHSSHQQVFLPTEHSPEELPALVRKPHGASTAKAWKQWVSLKSSPASLPQKSTSAVAVVVGVASRTELALTASAALCSSPHISLLCWLPGIATLVGLRWLEHISALGGEAQENPQGHKVVTWAMPGVSHLPRGGSGSVEGLFSPVKVCSLENTIKLQGLTCWGELSLWGWRSSPELACSEGLEIWNWDQGLYLIDNALVLAVRWFFGFNSLIAFPSQINPLP